MPDRVLGQYAVAHPDQNMSFHLDVIFGSRLVLFNGRQVGRQAGTEK